MAEVTPMKALTDGERIAWLQGRVAALEGEVTHLKAENERLLDALQGRKLIERAKGVLMVRRKWTEQTAYRNLQRASMERRVPMVELARLVLDGRDTL